MLKRRVLAELTQAQVAEFLGVIENTYNLWEQDKAVPVIRYYPAIFAFLGYDPFPPPATLAGQIEAKRRSFGLTQEAAAGLLGVDEGTLARWENGTFRPLLSEDRIDHFLKAVSPDDLATKKLPKRTRGVSKVAETIGRSLK